MPPTSSAQTQKQRFNIYSMMMIISFIAITISCVLLYLELAKFAVEGSTQWWWDTSAASQPAATSFWQDGPALVQPTTIEQRLS